MAVAQLNLSRRALLGAAFAAPVLSAVADAVPGWAGQGHVLSRHPGLDPGPTWFPSNASASQEERWMPDQVRHDEVVWGRAFARFEKADTALAALAGTGDEARYDRAGTRHDRALVRLLRTPAPHAAALADKIDLLIAHQAWEFRAADACLAALSADARRIAMAGTGSPQALARTTHF
jgi:hypothetical protein